MSRSGRPVLPVEIREKSGPRVTNLPLAGGYFFLAAGSSGCHVPIVRLGAAAITLGLDFFGFLASRLPLCWPLAMTSSLCVRAIL